MTDALLPIGDGHTELTDEDRQGLIPTYIATRGELFEAEQLNITDAVLGRHPTTAELLDDLYLRELHKAMFGDVWKWAGRYRQRETNIGVDPTTIAVAVRQLVDDANSWIEHAAFAPAESAIRFHHRLVHIHPFPNGNGRHGRIACDLLVAALDQAPFTWGAGLAVDTEELGRRYVSALRRAGAGEISDLHAFARS
jgi:Fic-DOC domain mobile mystery protein B